MVLEPKEMIFSGAKKFSLRLIQSSEPRETFREPGYIQISIHKLNRSVVQVCLIYRRGRSFNQTNRANGGVFSGCVTLVIEGFAV